MSDHPLQHILDALNAERYGPSLWWESENEKAAKRAAEDNDLAVARRRKELAEDFATLEKEA